MLLSRDSGMSVGRQISICYTVRLEDTNRVECELERIVNSELVRCTRMKVNGRSGLLGTADTTTIYFILYNR